MMSAGAQIVMWLIATLIPMGINLNTRDPDARGLSMVLALVWLFGIVMTSLYPVPLSMRLLPVVDLAAGLTIFLAWHSRPAVWKLMLVWLFMLQLLAHCAFWAHYVVLPSDEATVRYIVALNAIFALQLLTVAYPGARNVGALLVDRLRPRARLGGPSPGA